MKRVRHFAGVVAIAAVVASCAKSGPVTLSLASSQSRTGEVRMNLDSDFQEPEALSIDVNYSVRGTLPYLGDKLLAWSIGRRSKPFGEMEKLVFSFGIDGNIEKIDENRYVATDASKQKSVILWVDDAGGWWTYQKIAEGSNTSSGSSGCAPGTKCDVPPQSPPVPKNLLEPGEAIRRTNQYLARADMVPLNYPLDARKTEYSTEVFGPLTLGGIKTNIGVTFSYGDNGELMSASGPMISIAMAKLYPVISPTEAVQRLSNPLYGAIGGATRLAADVAVSSGNQPTTSSTSSVDVVITDARLLLMEARLSNGTHMLLPAYTFSNADGDVGTVIAITDDLLAFRKSVTTSTVVSPPATNVAPLPEPSEPGTITQSDADGLIGLTEQEATKTAESRGWIVRIAARDGEYFMLTSDYVTNRVNLTVEKTLVTAVAIG